MSTVLNPPFQIISHVKSSILANLKVELPPATLANTIAPLLSTVNLWSNQIPIMLEGSGISTSANLVFAIRKDLFHGPLYTQCILGPIVDLPPPFHEFVAFIHKLIDAQKGDKEKSVPKVRLVRSPLLLAYLSLIPLFLAQQTSWSCLQVQALRGRRRRC